MSHPYLFSFILSLVTLPYSNQQIVMSVFLAGAFTVFLEAKLSVVLLLRGSELS